MNRWEYCRLDWQRRTLTTFTEHGPHEEMIDAGAALYRLGQEGWELVSIVVMPAVPGSIETLPEQAHQLLTFKRPITEPGLYPISR